METLKDNRDKFEQWLWSSNTQTELVDNFGYISTLIKVNKNEKIAFLFMQGSYEKTVSTRNFEHVGIYNRIDGLVYDMLHTLYSKLSDDNEGEYRKFKDEYRALNRSVQAEKFKNEVRLAIETTIDNDINNLNVKSEKELKGSYSSNNVIFTHDIDYIRESKEREKVRKLFLDDTITEDVKFKSYFSLSYNNEFGDENFLEYITDGDNMVKRVATEWIGKHQEDMYLQFISNEVTRDELEKMRNDKDNPIHTVKKIIESVNSVDCKTVNITVVIEGRELTFKYEAKALKRDWGDCCSGYNVAGVDRKNFENTFGKHADFRPEDIKKITYGKKVLYAV